MGRSGGQSESQNREVEGGSLLRESDLFEGMGVRADSSSRREKPYEFSLLISARRAAGGETERVIFAFALMYPRPLAPGCRYVRQYHAMYNLKKTKKIQVVQTRAKP